MVTGCPGRLALCGVPCGCEGRNPSHYPPDDAWRKPLFLAPPPRTPHDDDQEDQEP